MCRDQDLTRLAHKRANDAAFDRNKSDKFMMQKAAQETQRQQDKERKEREAQRLQAEKDRDIADLARVNATLLQ